MYWKYHLQHGDLVKFRYNGEIVYGTLDKIRFPPGIDPEGEYTVDDIELSECSVIIQSGTEEVEVPMDDVLERTAKEERETDIPMLSEDLRLRGGVKNTL